MPDYTVTFHISAEDEDRVKDFVNDVLGAETYLESFTHVEFNEATMEEVEDDETESERS